MLAPPPERLKVWRLVIVGALLPLAITGALVLSASATITLLEAQGVPTAIAPSGVLMLEVASLAGTLLWVLVQNRSLRRDARLVVLAATAVSVVAGVLSFGLVGAVGGVMLVAVVHLASRAWREPWGETPQRQEKPPTVADLVAAAPSPAPATRRKVVAAAAKPVQVSERVTASTPALPDNWKYSTDTWEKAVEAAKAGTGRPTLIREHGINDPAARKVLAAARDAS